MVKIKLKILLILGVFLFSASGCASMKKRDLTLQELRNQNQVLQAQLTQKDQEIESLNEILAQKEKQSDDTGKSIPSYRSKTNVKQLQIALKNAGYNPGLIDGKMGKRTRQAIRAFQKANGLAVTGKVDNATWALLKKYLYKNSK